MPNRNETRWARRIAGVLVTVSVGVVTTLLVYGGFIIDK